MLNKVVLNSGFFAGIKLCVCVCVCVCVFVCVCLCVCVCVSSVNTYYTS